MSNSYNSKNYTAHGGDETVIGGKLTFLPGATVEGGEGLFDDASPSFTQMPNQAASEATTVSGLKESFNNLLFALKAAGLMVADDGGGE